MNLKDKVPTKCISNKIIFERRKDPRCDFLAKAECIVNGKPGRVHKEMIISNISKNGIFLLGHRKVSLGDKIEIIFRAPFTGFKEISLSGIVVWFNFMKVDNMKYIGIKLDKNMYQDRIEKFVNDVNLGYASG